jgi:hypothetical protein
MATSAVITADIVNSTLLPKPEAKRLMKNLLAVIEPYDHEFFRGDSFQVFVRSSSEALTVLLVLRTVAIKLLPAAVVPLSDIRASIGLANVKLPLKSLKTASGEAFVLSGRAFDKMNAGQRLAISCTEKNHIANLGLNVVARFADYLFQRLTPKQAAVVFELLQKRTQTETARRLKKSQATIHKHTQSAGWPEIEKLLSDYQLLINTIQP